MSSRRSCLRVIGLGALLALSSGACMMSVEAEAPEIEITQTNVSFDGVPAGFGLASMKQTFTGHHPSLDFPSELRAEVRAVQVILRAREGITDFAFLDSLRVVMQDDARKKAPVEILSYERGEIATPTPVLYLPAGNPANVIEQWKTDAAVFTLEVAGTLPERLWSVDVTLSFAGKASWKY
jgi:hypothetical protein